ncbi:MAG: cyclase family protein [Ilumatobacter sp.]|uniref:cyclase family protein n=1 Tax=Ilumatobacter sp. TaxID=1967498 RepID=UPI002616DDCD|nr:cyclase family protein [Ilumatobacter sp.]MDJ0767977.1 cyclase family protein [Ilumatobacter sp.]
MTGLPDYDDLPLRAGLPCAWDVWTDDGDAFGCLNLLTEERAAAAGQLIERGRAFALNWSMRLPDPPLFGRASYRHEITGDDVSTSHDDVLHSWNTQSSSQWDGFRHIRNHAALEDEPGTGHFGGVADGDHGVDHWARRGIVGRGVLADIARWRERQGRPLRCDRADDVGADELLACLADQGTEVDEGDVLLVRFGWVGWYEEQPTEVRERIADRSELRAPGLRPGDELARTLWNLHIAAIGCDNPSVEVWPPGVLLPEDRMAEVRADQRRLHEAFGHTVLLPMLGLPLGEMFALDDLAADCAADGRYDFFFSSAPLNLPSGVASPPNALAIK